jgi:hypothetical protein
MTLEAVISRSITGLILSFSLFGGKGEYMKKTKWFLAFVAVASLIASLSYAQGGYECVDCHVDGQVIHNCLAAGCHDTYDNGNHHTTGLSLAGVCTACHNPTLVADYDESNPFSYPATVATPTVQSCTTCHKGHANPLDKNGDPYPHPIYETAQLEHMDLQGHVSNCLLCHGNEPTTDPYAIRYCETCHSPETLHAIPGHVEGGFWYDENGDWIEITTNERCSGCHSGVPAMLYVPQSTDEWGRWYGTYDTIHAELDETDCRFCHGNSLADRHHALTGPCGDPPSPPVIDTDACEGMTPIVGVRMAQVGLTGAKFGQQVSAKCGDYKVEMRESTNGGSWIDLPAIEWINNLIEWSLPPDSFSPYRYHRVRVKTPAGISNKRLFYVLPAPMVSQIEDNTGKDAQGPPGGWITVYSRLDESQPFGKQGTFGNAREKWYEDTLGGTCRNFFGSIYVVTLTSSSGRFCAKVYDKWNVSGNRDSFKVRLLNIWEDLDSDYYKDWNEPKYGPDGDYPLSNVPLGLYSLQVCLVIHADSNGNGRFSGDRDTIYQAVKSKSDIIYDINADPMISRLRPGALEPAQKLVIKGYNFGTSQGSSVVHIGGRTFDSTSPRIKLWTADKIRIRVPNYACEVFGGNSSITRRVWVTVGAIDSNKEKLIINKPASCP